MAFGIDLEEYETLVRFALALGIGALIGIERERHRAETQVLAGIRTYPIVALAGAIAAFLAPLTEGAFLVSVGAAVAGGFALVMYWVRQRLGTTGLTSPVALFATYFVGVLIGYGFELEGIVAGVAVTVLLFTKQRLHHLAEVLSPKEMEGALYFIVIAFILYPLAPAEPVDPWGLFRLRNFLLIVILVSVLSFLSFLALRKWGSGRGFVYAGLLGGLVNSEAVAASLSQHAKKQPRLEDSARNGIILATATMFVRNLLIAMIADPSLTLARFVVIPLVVCAVVLSVWTVRRRSPPGAKETPLLLESPFALRPAFVFALWFGLVSVLTVVLTRTTGLGDTAVLVTALGGFVSAGAVTASMAVAVASGHVSVENAGLTVVVASLLSVANKYVISRAHAAPLAARLVAPLLSAIAVGAVLLVALRYP